MCLVTQSCPTLCDPIDGSLSGRPWGFFRQEYWSGLPCLPSGDLPDSGIKPRSSALQVVLYHLSHEGSPEDVVHIHIYNGIYYSVIEINEIMPFSATLMELSLPGSSAGKEAASNAADPGSIPGSGRFTGEGIDWSPLQHSWAFLVTQLVK